MFPADATLATLQLFASGPVGGWAGIALFIAAAVIVIWQLSLDLAGIRPTRITRWVLPGLRIGVVAMIAWLLCQPVLLIVRRWTSPPRIMVITDSGGSMQVSDGAGDVSRQLDLLEAVGKPPLPRRNGAASHMARACHAIGSGVSSTLVSLQEEQGAATTGLPLGPAVGRKLDALALLLRARADELIAARAQLPTDVSDKELKNALAELVASSQRIETSITALIADAAIVGKEASRSPSLLDAYLIRLKALGADAARVDKNASTLQVKLDASLLLAKDVEAVRDTPLTRQQLADMAGDRITTFSLPPSTSSAPTGVTWGRARSSSLGGALDDIFRTSLDSPLAAAVLLSDGSSPIGQDSSAMKRLGAKGAVPVSTVLIGADGAEPADAGLIALDVPRIALAEDPVTVRCLVKNLITTTPHPKLTLTIAKQAIGTQDLAVTPDGSGVVEFSWTPAATGRQQLLFKIESARPDAYPGNESGAAIVDVVANKARVLLVSDRLNNDFAAIGHILAEMPAIDARSIVAAPGFAKFHSGSKSDEFPATPADFKSLALLVLIGDVPDGAGHDVIESLNRAIDAGLHVWVQAPARPSPHSWASALAIDTRPIEGLHAIEPFRELWLDACQLGRETDDSADRWKEIPPIANLQEIRTPGVPLLSAGGEPVLALVPRQSGAALVAGIGDFSAVRSRSSAASVNRLLSQSLLLAMTAPLEPGKSGGLFPAQPVLGKQVFLCGEASPLSGLEPLSSTTWKLPENVKPFRVTDPASVSFQIGAIKTARIVRHLQSRRDFQLAAHAEPLEKISAASHGRHRDVLSMTDVVPPDLKGTARSSTTRLALWPGIWSLPVILILVSAEYLLRRKAGKVM